METQESPTRDAVDIDDGDLALARRIAAGDRAAFEQLMRRHNSALFRTARSIVRDDADAEDVLQDAYIAALRHMGDFRGGSRLTTWLTRIVINTALGRLRSRRRDNVVELVDARGPDSPLEQVMGDDPSTSPEQSAMRSQLRGLLEHQIDALPLAYRTAFILREVEEMTIDEAAECLAVPAATVRTRVFRARALLRAALAEQTDIAAADVFRFAGARCDRIVAGVLDRVRTSDAADPRTPRT
ncbi:MAG: RNA polymerase sigma factor [Caldimonas sp.]